MRAGVSIGPRAAPGPTHGERTFDPMDRFDKFTDRARKVLTLAQDEAQRFNHNYIGTEHLLLGLVREGEGVAARVLENMNVELSKVRTAVEFIIGRGDRPVVGEVGLTPRAKRVIELAIDEAWRSPTSAQLSSSASAAAVCRWWARSGRRRETTGSSSCRWTRRAASATTTSVPSTCCWVSCARERGSRPACSRAWASTSTRCD